MSSNPQISTSSQLGLFADETARDLGSARLVCNGSELASLRITATTRGGYSKSFFFRPQAGTHTQHTDMTIALHGVGPVFNLTLSPVDQADVSPSQRMRSVWGAASMGEMGASLPPQQETVPAIYVDPSKRARHNHRRTNATDITNASPPFFRPPVQALNGASISQYSPVHSVASTPNTTRTITPVSTPAAPMTPQPEASSSHSSSRYACATCRKTFATKSTLNRHVEQVEKRVERYICSECFSSHTQLSNCCRHMTELKAGCDVNLNPVGCPSCPFRCPTPALLKRHHCVPNWVLVYSNGDTKHGEGQSSSSQAGLLGDANSQFATTSALSPATPRSISRKRKGETPQHSPQNSASDLSSSTLVLSRSGTGNSSMSSFVDSCDSTDSYSDCSYNSKTTSPSHSSMLQRFDGFQFSSSSTPPVYPHPSPSPPAAAAATPVISQIPAHPTFPTDATVRMTQHQALDYPRNHTSASQTSAPPPARATFAIAQPVPHKLQISSLAYGQFYDGSPASSPIFPSSILPELPDQLEHYEPGTYNYPPRTAASSSLSPQPQYKPSGSPFPSQLIIPNFPSASPQPSPYGSLHPPGY